MDEELNEFGNPYPTLSEMADKYDELYKGTLSYQAMALRESVIVLGKELAVIFVNPLFNIFEAIADILYPYLAVPIIELLDIPLPDAVEIEPEYVEVLVRRDGEILVIEDAPAVEYIDKRKNS